MSEQKTKGFSAREVPWMKIGEITDSVKTAGEAAELGGLDFEVEKVPAGFQTESGEWTSVDNRVAVVRKDTGQFFNFTGTDYQILQYAEAFDFMDTVSPEFVAAGPLKGGKQGFMVVKPDVQITPGGDEHQMFVILRTSHDRSRAVEISIQSLRGACMNQLTLRSFAKGVPHRWTIHHTKSMHEKLKEAHKAMAQLDEYTTAFNRLAERLMVSQPTDDDARKLVDDALYFGGKKKPEIAEEILGLWHNDTEHVGYNDTAWGLLNAFSEYSEWHRPGRPGNEESRFITALSGSHHRAINRMTRQMLELAA